MYSGVSDMGDLRAALEEETRNGEEIRKVGSGESVAGADVGACS